MIRTLLALYLVAALAPAWRRGEPPTSWMLPASGVAALGLVVTTAAVGHPVAGPWPGLELPIAVIHVAAMTVWLGGLAGLVLGVLRPGIPADDVAVAMPRFSRMAFGSVVALVVTGIVQSVREVGTPAALVSTTYGWLLVTKLLVVAVILAAAGVSRVWVQQHLGVHHRPAGSRRVTAHAFAAESGDSISDDVVSDDGVSDDVDDAVAERARAQAGDAVAALPRLRRSVLVELALAVVVLGVTSVLVGTPPAESAVVQPVDTTLPLKGTSGTSGSVQVTIEPASAGPNVLHLYLFDDAGQPTQPAGITVTITEPSQQLGPIDVKLQPAGPGHYSADAMDIPAAGTWTLQISVRKDEFTAYTASTRFPVR
jgi:copper transport protein